MGATIDFEKLKPIMTLDSALEEVFYEKCREKQSFSNILIEWVNSKPVYENYTKMIVKSYGNYSKHDRSHSIAILDSIYAILGKDRVRELDIMDLWLLLHCAYAHDIGMPYTYDEAKQFWDSVSRPESEFRKFLQECIESSEDKDAKKAAEYIINMSKKLQDDSEKDIWKNVGINMQGGMTDSWPLTIARYNEYLVTEFCRKNHTKRSEKFMIQKADEIIYDTPYVLSSRFYRVIAACSMVHGEDFEEILKLDTEEWAKESASHPAFVAALLRLGDLLDIDNNRFDSIALKFYGRLPQISELHKMKHEAITHIALADNLIEVRAASNNLDVCKCINSWFAYIDREVRNLIFHWGEIAPANLKGCRLTLPKLMVLYNNQEFSSYESREFSVNKEMLIKLVVGRNLYASELDFVREYLQNALDALKMKFWLDLKEGILDIEIKDGVLRQLKGKHADLTPMDFKSSAFKRYVIDIVCRFVQDDERAWIEIKICDRGIGIEEECIKAISSIGSGWKKRSSYKKYLGNMPAWLKPTGGFGIGMQSGFMVADKVTIRTKCDNESVGRQITLYSSAKSGKIEEQQYEMSHTGTEVIVEIPYEKFMENYEYKGNKLLDEKSYGDFFDKNQIMQASLAILHKYTTNVTGSSIFPIIIKRKGFEAVEIKQEFDEEIKAIDSVEIDGYHYKIYGDGKSIYLWRVEDAILCELSNDTIDRQICWYYKGMSVEEKDRPKTSYFLKDFSSIRIDIMGGQVDDFLTVDRNQFMEKIDCEKIVRGFIETYYRSGKCVQSWLDENANNVISDVRKGYWYIWAFFYVKDEGIRDKIKQSMPLGESEDENATYKTIYKKKRDENASDENENIRRNAKSLLEVCRCLWNGKSIYIMNADHTQEQYAVDFLEYRDNGEFEDKEIILAPELYDILSHFHVKNINVVEDRDLKRKEVDGRLKIISYMDHDIKKENVSGKIVRSLIKDFGCYEIYWASDDFKELQVTKLPWNYKVNMPQGVFGNQEVHMIISPIRPIHRDKDIMTKIIEGKEEPLEEIKKVVLEDDSFTYLINWVYEHRVEDISKKEVIKKKYMEFIEWWYNSEFNDLL